MAEPKIVFCASNHIYDSSIHSECPYCQRIAYEQKALSEIVLGNTGAEEKEKELLNMGSVNDNPDNEDHTELISRSRENDNAEGTEEVDLTELIRRDENNENHMPERIGVSDDDNMEKTTYVIGWLVGANGNQKGHSIEIVEGNNYIYFQNGCLSLSPIRKEGNTDKGVIYQNINDEDFYIIPDSTLNCIINNLEIRNHFIIKPYDTVVLEGNKYIFVKLVSDFFDWGL